MSEDKRYNGWSNYETWVTKLWMDNEEGSSRYWAEEAQDCWDNALGSEDDARTELAERLKGQHEENTPETVGVYADLLNAALSEVDWHEIAQVLIDDEVDKAASETETTDEEVQP